jgi:hypothetical protein
MAGRLQSGKASWKRQHLAAQDGSTPQAEAKVLKAGYPE